MVIADNMAIYVDTVWGGFPSMNGSSLILASVLYSFQIYTDFSGYSDMAIGVGQLLGLRIRENFDRPYFARSVAEFWRRWHMSLTSWFTDYIYIPLGGNRCSKLRHLINILFVFIICGFWHGANWTFVFWGLYNGVLVAVNKGKKVNRNEKVNRDLNLLTFFRISITFLLVIIGWVVFRSENMVQAFSFFKGMTNNVMSVPFIHPTTLLYSAIGLVILLIKEFKDEFSPIKFKIYHNKNAVIRFSGYVVTVLLIMLMGVMDSGQFIYFKF